MSDLTPLEYTRYNRHIIIPEIGLSGQIKLKKSSVLLIGAGGLGSPIALYLAAAGVGTIGIIDEDDVDETNLQRQILHSTEWIGKPKVQSARHQLLNLNPALTLHIYKKRLTRENALELFAKYDVIADGSDNFPTRYLINDAAYFTRRPVVYGSIFRFEGQLSVFNYKKGPCYRCLYSEAPPPDLVPTCAEGGVLGVLPGVIGTLQANEVMKILLEIGDVASGRLILYDALKLRFKEMKIRKDPECRLCGEKADIHELIDYEDFCRPALKTEKPMDLELDITSEKVQDLLEQGEAPIFLDLRPRGSQDSQTPPGSLHITAPEIENYLKGPGADALCVLFCREGIASVPVVRDLRRKGFKNIKNLRGGLQQWIRFRNSSGQKEK